MSLGDVLIEDGSTLRTRGRLTEHKKSSQEIKRLCSSEDLLTIDAIYLSIGELCILHPDIELIEDTTSRWALESRERSIERIDDR